MKKYTVRMEYNAPTKQWTGELVEIPQVHTYGKSVRQVQGRIREALSVWLDDDAAAEKAEFVADLRIPKAAQAQAEKARALREAAREADAKASKELAKAIAALQGLGLSLRDTAEMLGVSHQRIAQLAEAG